MKINEIIKQKRIEKQFTQEQIAISLGVSTPAVNKWEKGTSYPDITLLPPLARLLDTDLNTLLSFQEDLSDHEIILFLNEIADSPKNSDFKISYDKVINKINEFPNCYSLVFHATTVLEGLLLQNGNKAMKEYEDKIKELYERSLQSSDLSIKVQAQSRLIGTYMKRKEYNAAEELLKDIPDNNPVDKKALQAKLFKAYHRLDDAARLEEERLISMTSNIQFTLLSLLDIAIEDNRIEDAAYIAEVSQKSAEIFDLWKYNQYIAHFELYTKTKNKIKSISTIIPMIKSITQKWDINNSPLYRHIKTNQNNNNFSSEFQQTLIDSIKNDKQTSFLKDEPELKDILK